jgi:CrcB protein
MIAAGVIAAGIVGTVLRFLAGRAFAQARFPWAVLLVNVAGSLAAGILLGIPLGDDLRLVLLTGFCGGLTTFSTFSVETIQLIQDGRARSALASVGANLVLGVGAAALGYAVSSTLYR